VYIALSTVLYSNPSAQPLYRGYSVAPTYQATNLGETGQQGTGQRQTTGKEKEGTDKGKDNSEKKERKEEEGKTIEERKKRSEGSEALI
jgi:hypothetical protein